MNKTSNELPFMIGETNGVIKIESTNGCNSVGVINNFDDAVYIIEACNNYKTAMDKIKKVKELVYDISLTEEEIIDKIYEIKL